jgi:hypothetical protein
MGEFSRVRLRALTGAPLRDARVRETVVSSAHAIAERTGVTLAAIDADDEGVTVTLPLDKIAAMGFLAELRRVTEQWHVKRTGRTLWGEPPETPPESPRGDGDPGGDEFPDVEWPH